MASVCFGGETKTSTPVEPSSKAARKRRMEIHQFNIVPADVAVMSPDIGRKSQKREASCLDSTPHESEVDDLHQNVFESDSEGSKPGPAIKSEGPKFGLTSVCGQRRDMEDAVAIHPSFSGGSHFYGVYDGHGCSHVAMKCKERMHEIVKHEVENRKEGEEWLETMTKSFSRMDEEVTEWSRNSGQLSPNCRCELQTPQCDAVGSTAVVALVTEDKIIVSNCGDSRAVICRGGVVTPLSNDHKPDRPDELKRIEDSGGRVIYWDGARVLGVLAMSRAIGDNYLKPYVISEPEVTVIDRTAEDECLVLASDGLWDVVTNETACGVARMCLSAKKPKSQTDMMCVSAACESSDKACSDASILLTKLALARHTADNVSVVVVDLRKDL
ncbi:Protein-serine/threonine phosphatase [Heracleum sosnowskyi]|uniref:protein-serine/threonine phosphatase n=1 Tax=Heracleum sosnowskyi TaxID=360622 RepID=A0AAD8I515_9APIA|nr:Protein-serine/threonine phosphatase [Heracleum sosnowskyi]